MEPETLCIGETLRRGDLRKNTKGQWRRISRRMEGTKVQIAGKYMSRESKGPTKSETLVEVPPAHLSTPSAAKQELAAVWEATGHPLPTLGTREKDAPKPFTPNKYTRTLHTLDGRKVPVDVYCVLAAFPTGSAAIDHAVKKLLAPGARGVKSRLQDIKEAHASLGRAIELEEGQGE